MQDTCYIAGRISGLDKDEYRRNFEAGKNEVAALGYKPISPCDLPHLTSVEWEDYMREDLTAMLQCKAVYALRNWHVSRGATIEVNLAKAIKMKIIYQS